MINLWLLFCPPAVAPLESCFSTTLDSGYLINGGTSAAAPHVSAVAGMLVTRPQFSAPQLAKNRILQRATYDPLVGWKLNAYEALKP